jgi:hypothetical protein
MHTRTNTQRQHELDRPLTSSSVCALFSSAPKRMASYLFATTKCDGVHVLRQAVQDRTRTESLSMIDRV